MNIFVNPEENRVRAGWRILLQFVLFIITGLGLVYLVNQVFEMHLEIHTSFSLFLGAIGSVWMAAKFLDHYSFQAYGLTWNGTWFKELGLGTLFAAIAMAIIFSIEWFAGWATVTGYGWERTHSLPYTLWFGNFLVAMVLVGFYEELIFRGYHIRNLTEGFSFEDFSPLYAVALAVGLSSVAFGLLHAGNQNASILSTLNIISAGAVIAVPFIITGRLAISVGLHFAWNFFQGGVFGFPVSGMAFRGSLLQIDQTGPELVTGGSFGPEAGLLGLLGEFVILALTLLYIKYSGQSISIHPSFKESFSRSNKSPEQAK